MPTDTSQSPGRKGQHPKFVDSADKCNCSRSLILKLWKFWGQCTIRRSQPKVPHGSICANGIKRFRNSLCMLRVNNVMITTVILLTGGRLGNCQVLKTLGILKILICGMNSSFVGTTIYCPASKQAKKCGKSCGRIYSGRSLR